MAWVTLDEGDNDAVVLWSHVIEALCRACPGLAHETLAALPHRAGARGGAATAGQRARRAARARARARRLPPALQRVDARERRVVRRPPARRPCSWCSRPAPIRRCRSARCGRAGNCWSCAPTSCASPAPEADEFLNARLGLELDRGRRRPARRPHRGLARRHLPGRAVARGHDGQARPGDGVRRHQRARRRLPRQRGARRPRARAAGVHAAHVRARAALRAAVRRGARAAASRRTRWTRWRARTSSCCRSTTAAAGFASTTCSPRSCAWSWSAASPRSCPSCTGARSSGTATTAPPTRRSTTRSRRGPSPRPGR